ncbi:MAG: antitoxin [Verrucomicrobia bacterium]|nr:antitoxin [Verrucomicrobiota bacterium]
MSKRLQVILEDAEMARVRRVAKAHRLTVAAWVRQALREALREQPMYDSAKKIQVVREAASNAYPAGDIDQMLGDIARGQQDGLDS